MDTWQTVGHKRVVHILNRQLQTATFSHAYALIGPERIGKKTLALEFAKKLLGAERLDTHPDFIVLDAKIDAGVARMRLFTEQLSAKPFLGNRIIALIDNADSLTSEAANGLLKTLEEPHKSVILILIAQSKNLLPTLLSRCQVFSCTQSSRMSLKIYAQAKYGGVSEDVLDIAGGAVGMLDMLLKDPGRSHQLLTLVKKFNAAANGSVFDKHLLSSELSDMDSDQLREALLCWSGSILSSAVTPARLQNILDALTGLAAHGQKKQVIYRAVLS
jgi:replication-associated recombination protein RarA